MAIDLRPASSADVEALEQLALDAYARYVPRLGFRPPPMVADFAQAVAAGRVTVAVEGPVVVGFVVVVFAPDHLLLENVAVQPAAQGNGVGGRLMDQAEREAARQGLGVVRLYTHELMVENQEHYLRHGYVETHRSAQDGIRRVFMAKYLNGDDPDTTKAAQESSRPGS